MSETITRPGVDPNLFFGTEVPNKYHQSVQELENQVKKLTERLEDIKAGQATMKIDIIGDGGNTFFLNVKDGKMVVSDASAQTPIVAVIQNIEDFKTNMASGIQTQFGQLGSSTTPQAPGSMMLSRKLISRMQAITGSIKLVLTGFPEGKQTSVTTVFGNAELPKENVDLTITMNLEDYKAVSSGKLNPQAAFMSGKMKLSGNMQLAMQLGTLML